MRSAVHFRILKDAVRASVDAQKKLNTKYGMKLFIKSSYRNSIPAMLNGRIFNYMGYHAYRTQKVMSTATEAIIISNDAYEIKRIMIQKKFHSEILENRIKRSDSAVEIVSDNVR